MLLSHNPWARQTNHTYQQHLVVLILYVASTAHAQAQYCYNNVMQCVGGGVCDLVFFSSTSAGFTLVLNYLCISSMHAHYVKWLLIIMSIVPVCKINLVWSEIKIRKQKVVFVFFKYLSSYSLVTNIILILAFTVYN